MGTLAAAGIVLIAPWTNNGINVLGVLFALLGRFWAFISSWEERFQNNERRRGCCNWNALCFPLIVPFGIMGNGFSNTNISFFRVALALLSSAIPFTLEMKALGQLQLVHLVF
jgi:inner membrane transporter RhtA